MSNNERAALTIREAATLLGVCRAVAYDLVRTGKIPSIRLGPKRIIVPRAQFEAMLAGTWKPSPKDGQQ